MGFGEVGFGKVGIGEVGFGEVGIGEVGFGEVGIGEVGFGEVGFGEVVGHRQGSFPLICFLHKLLGFCHHIQGIDLQTENPAEDQVQDWCPGLQVPPWNSPAIPIGDAQRSCGHCRPTIPPICRAWGPRCPTFQDGQIRLPNRMFAVSGPTFWNSLTNELKSSSLTEPAFKKQLKTFLFRNV